ncbi:MAG: peptidylprolyl isomerase [Myxococcota bacterium]
MTPPRRQWLASPLLHFIAAGGLLFGLALLLDVGDARSRLAAPDGSAGAPVRPRPGAAASPESDGIIRVERDALLAFVQTRTRTPSLAATVAAFDAAPEAVRRDWLERFVREEALVREARALGLDREDELVRRRLVQQMEFLVEDTSGGAPSVSEAELEAAYRERAESFREPATVRFAHVFVAPRPGGGSGAEGSAGGREGGEGSAPEAFERAERLRERLDREGIGFDDAFAIGDRFLYDRVYVDRNLDEVRSHFGDAMAATLERLPVDPDRWSGPHRSDHGLHLVLLIARRDSRLPALPEVAASLREELLREKRERALEQGVAAIVGKYRIEREATLGIGNGRVAASPP